MPRISDERREERRRAILDATVQCLTAHGYLGTSMRTIAEAAGLTKGGLYAYFENKEAIVLAVADEQMRHQLAGLEPVPGRSAREQLLALFDEYDRANADRRIVATQRAVLDLWHYAGDLPAARKALRARYAHYVATIADVVRRAQADGTVPAGAAPEQVAALILAARDGMVYHAVKLRLPVPLRDLTVLLRTLVAGAAPR